MHDPQREKQRGKSLLSSAEMWLLENFRSQLRSAVQLALKGDVAAARLALVKVKCFDARMILCRQSMLHLASDILVYLQLIDVNEEVLLHVFGRTLPLDYDLGMYSQTATGAVCLDLAKVQADQLLEVCIYEHLKCCLL